jgi:acyl-CoA synthetase (AMP-forming)/AMP-acid ligase II
MVDSFDPGSFLDILAREEITHGFVAPTILNAVVHHEGASRRSFPKLKYLLSASAPISESTLRKSADLFGEHVLHSAYGQTEILPVAGMGPDAWFSTLDGSSPISAVGRPMPLVDVEIRDEAGTVLGPGEPGEIVARYEGVQMDGFWDDPEETARRMVDGWIKTGDIGTLDANGLLYLLDRSNDMIVSGGFNIYPNEIENVIAEHPHVIEVAVFGIPHKKWGETPLAMVRLTQDATVTEADIIELVRTRLGSTKKPSRVEFTLDPLPLSNVGKVLRSKLREPYWAGHDHRVAGA